jgi:hypothetical protein
MTDRAAPDPRTLVPQGQYEEGLPEERHPLLLARKV